MARWCRLTTSLATTNRSLATAPVYEIITYTARTYEYVRWSGVYSVYDYDNIIIDVFAGPVIVDEKSRNPQYIA